MNPKPQLCLCLIVFVSGILSSVADAQGAVSAFGRISQVEKVLEGPAAKIQSTVRQAQLNVTNELAARGAGAEIAAMSVPRLWEVRADGAIRVYLWLTDLTEREVRILKNAGVVIETQEPTVMKAVATWLTPAAIDRVAELDVVKAITFPDYAKPMSGSVTTQGDSILKANVARLRGFNGQGVKVGVISNGVDNRNAAAALGDLPQSSPGVAAVQVNPALPGSGDEGTAMLEIVHDLAPAASLAFSGAPDTIGFINSVNWLANTANCNVICDDIGLLAEPYFADGVAAQTCQAAVNNGHTYVSAAGNFRQNHYQGAFNSLFVFPAFDPFNVWFLQSWAGTSDHSLDIIVAASGASTTIFVYLQWDEQFGAAAADYDLYIVDYNETAIHVQSNNVQNGSGYPFESVGLTVPPSAFASGYKVWVRKANPTAPNKNIELFIYQQGGTPVITNMIDHNVPNDSIWGHAAAQDVISCAAVHQAQGSPWCPPAYYSSFGPSTITVPTTVTRSTPTLMAVDGVSVTGSGGFSNPFYGTSAAAPHVAGIAALLKSAKPSATPADIRYWLALGATDCGPGGYDNTSGYGLVDAAASIGLACPGAGFECQPGGCAYTFPLGLGAVGDCEGSSVNGAAPVTVDSVPNGAGFPTDGNQYARIRASGPGSAAGGGNMLFLKLAPMTLTWDFYNAEMQNSLYNDGMSIDVLAQDGVTVLANLAYADTYTPSGGTLDSGGCASAFNDAAPPGPQRVTVNAIPGGVYVRVSVWNGGDNLVPSMACVDIDPASRIDYFSVAPGTIGFTVSHGPKYGTYFAAISLAPGNTPNGWFYGLDIPIGMFMSELNTGLPFWGPLDRNGGYTFGPICCLPSGTPVYSVAAFMNGTGLGTPIASSPLAVYVIP